jgi:hypothetical protein
MFLALYLGIYLHQWKIKVGPVALLYIAIWHAYLLYMCLTDPTKQKKTKPGADQFFTDDGKWYTSIGYNSICWCIYILISTSQGFGINICKPTCRALCLKNNINKIDKLVYVTFGNISVSYGSVSAATTDFVCL